MEILKGRVSRNIYLRLETAKITTLEYFLLTPVAEICDATRLRAADVDVVVAAVSELLSKGAFTKDVGPCRRLRTGCGIDGVFGGFPTLGVTEVYGASGSGKTQLALQLALHVQEPPAIGGLNGGAVYVCTEDAFPSRRLHELSAHVRAERANKINYGDNIYVEHIEDVDKLKHLLRVRLPILLLRSRISLIVIDSIAGAFRYDNDSQNYISRSEDLQFIAAKLSDIAERHRIAVVCINQVTSDGDGDRPCLGLAWSNLVRLRVKISRTADVRRIDDQSVCVRRFEIIYSPEDPPAACLFCITNKGIICT